MKHKHVDFVTLLRKHSSGWVGISPDYSSVLVSGTTLKETRKKAEKLKQKVYFFPAGEVYSNYIGIAKK